MPVIKTYSFSKSRVVVRHVPLQCKFSCTQHAHCTIGTVIWQALFFAVPWLWYATNVLSSQCSHKTHGCSECLMIVSSWTCPLNLKKKGLRYMCDTLHTSRKPCREPPIRLPWLHVWCHCASYCGPCLSRWPQYSSVVELEGMLQTYSARVDVLIVLRRTRTCRFAETKKTKTRSTANCNLAKHKRSCLLWLRSR